LLLINQFDLDLVVRASAAVVLVSVADYDSANCEVTFSAPDRTLAVGPSNANKCGGELFPWLLKVDAGQRVNVTLIQFSINDDDGHHDDDPSRLSASSRDVVDAQYDVVDSTGNVELSVVAISNAYVVLDLSSSRQ